ncbi:MAG: aspartate--tRNA ligase [Oscillospiraceae bacterium]|nr:aspartate--tRNA ligase [Oscillospiraceae bacterium]
MYRTHTCGEINKSDVGKKVQLAGWIQTTRDMGGIIFIDLRDQYGITQIVSADNVDLINSIAKIPTESTVTVTGTVKLRDESTINKNIKTGEVEVSLETIEVLGKRTKNLPFEVNTDQEVREDLRLQYRFLDLRSDKNIKNLILRANVIQFMREQMIAQGFLEVQTPILTSSSPEGARDYLVPSRVHPGKFYALPQAPQQFKQLLVTSGIDKYFQIAPCFRDEDSRADRSPGEFYQLDMEMAFATQEDVFSVIQKVMYNTFKKFTDKTVDEDFVRIPFKEALEKYGSDKPDLRNPLIVQDVTHIFKNIDFNAFKGKIVKIISTPNVKNEPRSFFDGMTEFAISECDAKGLAWLRVNDDRTLQGPIAKFIPDEQREQLLTETSTNAGDAIFFIAEDKKLVQKLAGQIRIELGKRLNLIDKNIFKFCWIIDFPMYEEEDNKIQFCHNPFSMPQGGLKALEEKYPLDVYAYQYDIVCNGIELSSGAVRNHDPEIMVRAFEIAGYDKSVIEQKFPALYNAFQYGAPPHAGIAPGIDRIVMLLADSENIRDIIAFPMNSKAQDLLMNAPSAVTEKQLKEIHIKLDVKE